LINEQTNVSLGAVIRAIGVLAALVAGVLVTNDRIAALESRVRSIETVESFSELQKLPSRLSTIEAKIDLLTGDRKEQRKAERN
jgi:tetrahydromethanopterin S-methyltransferase subunit G